MNHRLMPVAVGAAALTLLTLPPAVLGQSDVVHVALAYGAPGNGPSPNFSPKGTQIQMKLVPPGAPLPAGATRPAKSGVIEVGPTHDSWIPVLATASAEHPSDLCQLFIDRNRNGNFTDDGPAVAAVPTQNEKTKAWWSSFNKVELSVPYAPSKTIEPYLVNFWIVRDPDAPAPDILRYSVGSWRFGTATVNGVSALVAAMDSDNNAMFGPDDDWSVIEASAPDASKAVLSIAEARPTNRLMFLEGGSRELVLEFRSFSPDGRSIDFAVVNRPVTKMADRAPDDMVAPERRRPRAMTPFTWGHNFTAALAKAKASHQLVFVDFEATWCGPCKTMDEWIWTDADVAARLNAGYVGVKLDADLEKALVKRFEIRGYPTMLVLDSTGKEIKRVEEYQSSEAMLAFLEPKR